MSRDSIVRDLFRAVHFGRSEEITKSLYSYGLSEFAAWSKGYLLLLRAIKNRNTEIVEFLLANNCGVNSTVPNKASPLHVAVAMGEIKIIGMLLDRQAEIDARDENQRTPLLVAIAGGTSKYKKPTRNIDWRREIQMREVHEKTRVKIIKLLLKRGADVNVHDESNELPLQVAIVNREIEIIKLLLDHHANPNIRDKQNRSLLRRALITKPISIKDKRLVVESLLNHGADPNISEMDGQSALHVAVNVMDSNIVEMLIAHKADVNARNKEKRTPLHDAVMNLLKKYIEHQMAICDLLLEHGASPDLYDIEGNTPLHRLHVCINRFKNSNDPQLCKAYVQIIKNLVTHGADINSVSYGGRGNTPLQWATDENCDAEIIKCFVSMGAEVNPKTDYESTPLYHAARHGNGPSTKVLVDHGAMTDPECNGKSIIQIAVDSRSPETIEQILTCCYANDNANNKFRVVMKGTNLKSERLSYRLRSWFKERAGKKIVITSKHYKMVLNNYILDAYAHHPQFDASGKSSSDGSPTELYSREVRIVKLLLSKWFDIDFDPDGKISLMYAIEYDDVEMTKLCLLDHTRVDPEVLNFAVAMGRLEIVDILLKYDHYININAFDNGGRQALHFAAMSKQDLSFNIDPEISIDDDAKDDIAKLLVHRGATVINHSVEMSPLVIAARNNRVKLVEFLIQNDAEFSRRDFKTIHAAAKNNAVDVVKLLLRYGVDIDVKDIGMARNTAFYIASTPAGHAEMVEFLLSMGAYMGFDCNGIRWRTYDWNRRTGPDTEEFFKIFFVGWSKSPEVQEVIQRHILRIIGSSERLDRGDLRQIDKDASNEGLIGFVEKCQLEIAKMRSEKIGDSNIFFYDIFEKGIDQLTMYARNESVVEAWKSRDLTKEFPIHYNVMNINFSKALSRVLLLDLAAEVFQCISGYEFMPKLMMDHVFRYLNDEDLKNLIAAGCNSNEDA